MKKEKLLSSLAATSLVLTQAGQLSVFAEENNNSVIEPATSETQKKKLKKFMIHTMKALMYLQRQMSIH